MSLDKYNKSIQVKRFKRRWMSEADPLPLENDITNNPGTAARQPNYDVLPGRDVSVAFALTSCSSSLPR